MYEEMTLLEFTKVANTLSKMGKSPALKADATGRVDYDVEEPLQRLEPQVLSLGVSSIIF